MEEIALNIRIHGPVVEVRLASGVGRIITVTYSDGYSHAGMPIAESDGPIVDLKLIDGVGIHFSFASGASLSAVFTDATAASSPDALPSSGQSGPETG
jgi:hypothetical protein